MVLNEKYKRIKEMLDKKISIDVISKKLDYLKLRF